MLGLCLAGHVAGAQTPAARAAPKAEPPREKAEPVEKCGRYTLARNAAFAAQIKTILAELPQRGGDTGPGETLAALEPLYLGYEEQAKAGEINPLRKLVAIEIFLSQVRGQPTRELTLRKACFLAKVPEKMRTILDALTCAVIQLEPGRRENEASRTEARQMLEAAEKLVPAGANASSMAKILYDDIARGLQGCF